jgi:hypothetical protein
MSTTPKKPGKVTKELNNAERQLKTYREKNMCRCSHTTRKGEPDMRPSHKKKPGLIVYICEQCQKELYLNKIPDEDQDQALAIVDNMIDAIKMSTNPNSEKEKDQKFIERLSEVQYMVRTQIKPAYEKVLRGEGKQKNKKNHDNDSTWEKSEIIGR